MMDALAELRQDASELESLLQRATRPKVKDALSLALRRTQTEVTKCRDELAASGDGAPTQQSQAAGATRCLHQLTTYAWDQSDKFMKIYATLDSIQPSDSAKVKSEFTSRSFKMTVTDLDGKDYCLHVAFLSEDIDPSTSYHKVKKNQVLLMLKKVTQAKTWPYVIAKDNKQKKSSPKMDDKKDPGDGLMDLLKQMHDDGDDEMKRTIQKAWHESRAKQTPDL